MATLVSIITKIAAVSFVFGQLARISFLQFNFPVIDLIIILLATLTLINSHKTLNLKHPWWKFIAYLWLLTLIKIAIFGFSGITPTLYLIRLTSLLIIIIAAPKLTIKNDQFLDLCLISLVAFGLIQYIVWPDTTFFSASDWDPHLNRLVASFFDPTFTAIIYLLFLLKTILKPTKSFPDYFVAALTYIAISLTYSRSVFLSLLAVSFFISRKTGKIKIFVFTIILISATLFLLPKKEGEGNRLQRTSTIIAKIENYREGLKLFTKSPIFGTGYNTIGLYRSQIKPSSHARWGFDGSLLNIAITGGVIGLYLFTSGLFYRFRQSNLVEQSMLFSLLIHSLFSNSLLFPWVLLYLGLTKYRN